MSSVVLPEPRKPVRMVAGMSLSAMVSLGSRCVAAPDEARMLQLGSEAGDSSRVDSQEVLVVIGYSRGSSTPDTATVSDPQSGRSGRPTRASAEVDKRTLFERLVEFLSPGPDSRAQLIETLADAEQRSLIEPESRAMLEGVLRMADMTAGDVMVAAPRMDLLAIDAPYDELLAAVIGTGHSRFPVFEGQRENIIGTLMAKDLLKLQRAPGLNLRTLLRPAVFVPESKNLNELLREFRSNRNHLAIVIDEFATRPGC